MKFPFDLSANKIKIIDVGARAVPEGFHYEALVDSNACVVTAVEPDAKANKWLTNRAIDKIHNVAIGDGGVHEMHVCQLASCSSMLAPNKACLEFYSGMEFFYRVEKINTIKTYGFDVVFSDAHFDYLDIDVQGYELEVLKSGGRNIKNLLGIHIEVSFVEKYVGQPLFRDVDVFLAERDFTFHCFTGYGTRSPRGVKVDGSSVNGINQWLWADAFYFHRLDDNAFWGVSNRLVKLACIFHCVYKSYDFAVHALKRCDQLGGSVYCHEYVRYLQEMGVDVEEGEDSEWIMEGMIKKIESYLTVIFPERSCVMPHLSEKKDRESGGMDSLSFKLLDSTIAARKIFITGEINTKMAKDAVQQLHALAYMSDEPIIVFISSPGGHVESGDMIFDAIRFIKPVVITIGSGWVASAGALIYVAADKENRYSLPNTRFLLHQPSGGFQGKAMDFEAYAKEIIEMKERLNRIFSDATGQPIEKVRIDTDKDFWLSAEEAVEYGLVHSIVVKENEINK